LFKPVTQVTYPNNALSMIIEDGECGVLISSVLQILDRDQLRARGVPDKIEQDYQTVIKEAAAQLPSPNARVEKESPPPLTIPRPILPEFHVPSGGACGVEGFLRALKKDEEKNAHARVLDLFE
jgi:hypothetical protein